MAPPIAILGAGPSGLALGRMLELANIDYIIFERDISDNEMTARAGTLDIRTGSGQLALQEAGLLDQFKKLARRDAHTILADGQGNVYIRTGESDEINEDRPEIDRKDLRALLLNSIPANKVCWGSRVQQVQRDTDKSMSVRFADGSIKSGFRLVVGADGAWSKARNLVSHISDISLWATNTEKGHIRQTSIFWAALLDYNHQAGEPVSLHRLLAGWAR